MSHARTPLDRGPTSGPHASDPGHVTSGRVTSGRVASDVLFRRSPIGHSGWARRWVVCLALLLPAISVHGQATSPDRSEDPDLSPRTVTLRTHDGLSLRSFYFPSAKGKRAIPVLLVHEWGGQGSPYSGLVEAFREVGCAVLVPEYRGHGGSREQVDVRGNAVTLDPGAMRRFDALAVINADLEAARSFLKDENNEGRLNLNAMAVVGVGEGALLAAHWVIADWRFPSVGAKKQGQDVKALVMVSPQRNFMGIGIDPILRDPTFLGLPVMVMAGADSPEAGEAERIARQLESMKRRVGRGRALRFAQVMPGTNLSGPRLINDVREAIPAIVRFVTNEIDTSPEQTPWIERN